MSIRSYLREILYLEGFSGDGETGSLVIVMRPDLYAAFLAISTRWDGDLNVLAASRTTIYLAIAENDTYYGSAPLKRAYEELCEIYRGDGVSDEENR